MGNVESAEYEFGRFASELPDPQSPASQFSMLVNKCAQYLLVRTRNKSLRELVGFSEGVRVLVTSLLEYSYMYIIEFLFAEECL